MKTISSDYIKEIKAQIRVINEALKRIQEAEKIQDSAAKTMISPTMVSEPTTWVQATE